MKIITCLIINSQNVDIDKIPDYNYEQIFDKVKRQMKSWSKRNITPLGRSVVAKSLLLPQFNHFFLSIPGPSANLMKVISYFLFIWCGKLCNFWFCCIFWTGLTQMCKPDAIIGSNSLQCNIDDIAERANCKEVQ